MSRTRPESLDSATKHLFRHLDDWGKLQSNPIAQKHFADAAAVGGGQALAYLRARVKDAAEEIRRELASADGQERVLRQLDIIRLQYFERRTIEDTAKLLGLSVKHCYRERAEACKLIALRLLRVKAQVGLVTSNDDAFYILLDRFVAGDRRSPNDNLRALRFLRGVAQSAHQEIAALHCSIEMALLIGERIEAQNAFSEAARLMAQHFRVIPPGLLSVVQASHEIAAWDLANYDGDGGRAFASAKASVMLISHAEHANTSYLRELKARAHFNLAMVLWSGGDLSGAYDALCRAVSFCGRRNLPHRLGIEGQGALWKVRGYLVATKTSNYRSQERLDGLREAYVNARDAAFPEQALEILLSIVECHAFAKRDDKALGAARAAIKLSRQVHNPLVHYRISIDVGLRLLATSVWREGLKFIPPQNALPHFTPYYSALATYATALCALRRGEFNETLTLLRSIGAKRFSASLDIRCQLLTAESAFRLGRSGIARETAEFAADAAERLGSAPLMNDAFAAAARICRKETFDSRAWEIARILAA